MPTERPTLLSDVRVFDGRELHPRLSVLVRRGRIAEIGAEIDPPPDCERVAGAGRTLLPGFVDAHTHTLSREDLRQALVFGVCTELDMFGDPELMAELKSLAAGDNTVAELRSAGTGATAPGGHPTQLAEMGMFPEFPTLSDGDSAEEFVAGRIAEGSDYLKLILDDGEWLGTPLPTLSDRQVRAVVESAHDHGKQAVAHVSTHADALRALDSDVDGLAHVPLDRDPPPEFGQRIARAGMFVIPTLSVWEAKFGHRRENALCADPRLRPFVAPDVRGCTEGTWAEVFGVDQPDWPGPDHARRAIRELHQAGVPLLAGTDAASPRSVHGLNLHGELAALVEAGLSPSEALGAATATPAECFGLADRGRIEPGARADLLLVDGDPTADIAATTNIARIWRGGAPVQRVPDRREEV